MKHRLALATAGLALTAGLVTTAVSANAGDELPAGTPSAAPSPVGDRFARTELFFGTDKPGPDVSNDQFRRFVRDEVTPRFPDGLTLYNAVGQFRGDDGRIVRERSKVIILLYPVASAEDSSREIEEIRDAYEDAFQQESVLRADSVDRVSF